MTARKAPERRQRGAKTKDVGIVRVLPGAAAVHPSADQRWRAEVREAWDELWSSQLVQALKPTDLPAMRRLFDLRDRWLAAAEAFDAAPVTAGSMGQDTLSPWAQEMHRLDAAIGKLEDRFGLTPMARLKLGVVFEEGVSLAARNADLLETFRRSQAT